MTKRSRFFRVLNVLASVVIVLSMSVSAFAQDTGGFTAQPLTADSTISVDKEGAAKPSVAGIAAAGGEAMVSVIVKLDDASLADYTGDIAGLPATSPTVTGAAALDVSSAASQLYLAYLAEQQETFSVDVQKAVSNAQITHRYDVIIGGVAMVLPESQLAALASVPGVEAIYADELLQLETSRTPAFIGAPTTWNKLGGQGSAGQGVIVGILDTGIWPEHPSLSDPDPLGKPYAAPPAPPVGTRACEFTGGVNPGAMFTCNNKLIGADRFMATYDAVIGLLPAEFTTARDDNGHGTHTATTAAGNRGVAASIFGVSRGTISGIAPRAYVMAYKVCGDQGCFSSDSAAAVQEAIRDGVNVINFSISGGTNPYGDAVSLAFLDAYNAGVFVAASAGNSGPTPETVNHREPWVATVAASTHDRAYASMLTLDDGAGGTLSIVGTTLTAGAGPAPIVENTADPLCQVPAAPGSFAGQIVVCRRGTNARTNKGFNVLQGGAAGMILYNQSTAVTDVETDNHYLPTVHIQFTEGQAVLAFMAANPGATASFPAGTSASAQGDVMASFSSRGGPGQTLGVSKPDITAPGVQVLAGHTPMSADPDTGPQGELFQAIAGTSMSSPHIAGSGALIKALHPSWTPGQIKSALMTSAKASGLVKEDGVTPFTPFDAGTGRVDLRKAWDPGLTFDETGANYLALQNQLWNANYPSLYVPTMPGLVTVHRTAKEVSGYDSSYSVKVEYPAGQARDFRVIAPKSFWVPANGTIDIEISVDARDVPIGQVRHATVVMREVNGCIVRFPVTIVRRQPVVTMNKSCTPGVFARGDTADCAITITNNSFSPANVSLVDNLPRQIEIVPGTVVNATEDSWDRLSFNGVVAGAEPPNVTIANVPGGSPAGGYLPLSIFGVAPIAGVGDETISNFNVPAFTYAGETYTRIGIVSNGYAVVGGGTGADVQFVNQNLPNATPPNNVLAPFWTDLNPAFGGAMRIGTLTDGADTWIVLDWAGVREYSANRRDSFQIWIGINADANPGEDISFTYGALEGNGDLGFLTVGAENRFGNRGANYYVDGVGTLPTSATELVVSGVPGAPGETRTITFTVKGMRRGKWVNYAEMTSDLFFGTSIARFAGEVTVP